MEDEKECAVESTPMETEMVDIETIGATFLLCNFTDAQFYDFCVYLKEENVPSKMVDVYKEIRSFELVLAELDMLPPRPSEDEKSDAIKWRDTLAELCAKKDGLMDKAIYVFEHFDMYEFLRTAELERIRNAESLQPPQ